MPASAFFSACTLRVNVFLILMNVCAGCVCANDSCHDVLFGCNLQCKLMCVGSVYLQLLDFRLRNASLHGSARVLQAISSAVPYIHIPSQPPDKSTKLFEITWKGGENSDLHTRLPSQQLLFTNIYNMLYDTTCISLSCLAGGMPAHCSAFGTWSCWVAHCTAFKDSASDHHKIGKNLPNIQAKFHWTDRTRAEAPQSNRIMHIKNFQDQRRSQTLEFAFLSLCQRFAEWR